MSVERGVAVFGSIVVRSTLFAAEEPLSIGADDEVRLGVVRQGVVRVRSAGRVNVLRAGEAVFTLAGERVDSIAECDVEILSVAGPGELAADLGTGATKARFISKESVLLGPTAAFAFQAIGSSAERTRLGDYYFERLLQEMLQGLLTDTAVIGLSLRLSPDPYAHALSVMEAQFADPTLTTVGIAEAVRLSRRQLEREFCKRGTTVRSELRRIRIDHAFDMLRDPDLGSLGIDQIARHVGFSGASSLARAMAEAGHASPSKVRAAAFMTRPALPIVRIAS